MAAKCHDPEHGQHHIHDLLELCSELPSSPNQLRSLDEATIIEVIQLAIQYNHAQIFGLISSNISITLPPAGFFPWAGECLTNVDIPVGALIPT